jgi:NurA domain
MCAIAIRGVARGNQAISSSVKGDSTMLNRVQLMQALASVSSSLFVDNSSAYAIARSTWEARIEDDDFLEKACRVETKWAIPSWASRLDTTIPVPALSTGYQVVSVDGSQIYPDRHQGISCYLINIGSAVIHYGASTSPVMFDSRPTVFATGDGDESYQQVNIHELINCRRQELELNAGLELMRSVYARNQRSLLLFDGSLVFWNLEAKDSHLSDLFLSTYLATLYQLYQCRALYAGYISLPKSRELVNLVRLALCNFNVEDTHLYAVVDPVVDATMASFFLAAHMRTAVFCNNAAISRLYPDALRPHFFYLHVGTEIGRVEIPGWIAADEALVNQIASLILDQSIKGAGYPVVLAEAHEQAVVKGPDRDFFYHALSKESMVHDRALSLSGKVLRKRRIGI